MINTVLTYQQLYYEEGEEWRGPIMMGRKFEAERALWFARRRSLVHVTHWGTNPQHDLAVTNFAPILYVEIKWGKNGDISHDEMRKAIGNSYDHPQDSYLLEANELSTESEKYLESRGGKPLPVYIKYPSRPEE